MNQERGKEFYRNFLDLNRNVDAQAEKQRSTYDGNLRESLPSAEQKFLTAQNAALRQDRETLQKKIARLEKKNEE